jgi:hypothetical protein
MTWAGAEAGVAVWIETSGTKITPLIQGRFDLTQLLILG